MQTNNILTIQNIHSIKGTQIPTPNLIEKFIIWHIESSEFQYRMVITHNIEADLVMTINRENAHYPGSLAKDVNSYICIMEHKYGYEIDEEKWVLETEDFKDKDTFIKIIGERAEQLVFKRIMRQKKEAARMVTIPNHPPLKTLHSTGFKKTPISYKPKESKPMVFKRIMRQKKEAARMVTIPNYMIPNYPPVSTLHSTGYKETPIFDKPKESKPNLTHKIKKIMQELGQLPDYIIHKIQYYIRKIV